MCKSILRVIWVLVPCLLAGCASPSCGDLGELLAQCQNERFDMQAGLAISAPTCELLNVSGEGEYNQDLSSQGGGGYTLPPPPPTSD